MGAVCDLSARERQRLRAPNGVGSAQAGDTARSRSLRRGTMGELYRDADRRLGLRRRERIGAPELARRRRGAGCDRIPVSTIALRARDLPLLECEAITAG